MKKPNGHHTEESIIQFPCDFTLKIMGKANNAFEEIALAIVKKYFPTLDASRIQKKFSKDNNYLSLSITVYAESKTQLDAAYQALSSTKEILMVL